MFAPRLVLCVCARLRETGSAVLVIKLIKYYRIGSPLAQLARTSHRRPGRTPMESVAAGRADATPGKALVVLSLRKEGYEGDVGWGDARGKGWKEKC